MSVKLYQDRANRIIEFFQGNNRNRKLTIDHFLAENVPRRSIQSILKRFIDEDCIQFRKKSGRPRTINTKENQKRVRSSFINNPSKSVRNAGENLDIHYSSVHRIKQTLGMKTYTKKKKPKYIKNQELRARKGSKYIYNKVVPSGGNFICVIDDETYVPADPNQVPGKEFYSEIPGVQLDQSQKVIKKEKYYKKFLIWQAISSSGKLSLPYIQEGAMKSNIYLKECIRKRLIPFVKSINAENVFFWPDLATIHYTKDVLEELEKNNIKYVPKQKNPPNLPQARPIENFWALTKREFKKSVKKQCTLRNFKINWSRISKRVVENHGKSLFTNWTKKLSKIYNKGVYHV